MIPSTPIMPDPNPKALDQVLLVDDSPLVLSYARRVLEPLGLDLQTAENGLRGLDAMRRRPADLVITDLMMPEMDGFDFIAELRRDTRFESTHVIVMTALDQLKDKVRALDLGANDYTVKPIEAMELRSRVQSGFREIHLKKKLSAALATLDQELIRVARLQRRLLPKTLPQGDRFRTAADYQPCSRAGGDYYDFFPAPDGRLVVTVADVSGHGASAAVLMGMVRALLKVFVKTTSSPAEALNRLNQALLENIGDDPDFVTLFLGLWDPANGWLDYASAGHGEMLLVGPEPGRIHRLASTGTVLGCFPSVWTETRLSTPRGMALVLYTDGLVEAVNGRDEEFGLDRLMALLAGTQPSGRPQKTVEAIRRVVANHTQGRDFIDDFTVFVLEFL
jgi:sigma-B regulation protein RsbU (phosphoserine phosphatase)